MAEDDVFCLFNVGGVMEFFADPVIRVIGVALALVWGGQFMRNLFRGVYNWQRKTDSGQW